MVKPLLPPKESRTRGSVSLTDSLWKDIQSVVDATDYSRDEVIEQFLRWAYSEWLKQREVMKKPENKQK